MTKPRRKKGRTSAKGGAGSIYDAYDKRRYASLERKLAADPKSWLDTEDLITALAANTSEPIPALVLEHLRRRLDGSAKKPRGRKKKSDANSLLRNHLVPIYYERYMVWLQKRDRTQGLAGWSCIRTAPWWQGPPTSGRPEWSRPLSSGMSTGDTSSTSFQMRVHKNSPDLI